MSLQLGKTWGPIRRSSSTSAQATGPACKRWSISVARSQAARSPCGASSAAKAIRQRLWPTLPRPSESSAGNRDIQFARSLRAVALAQIASEWLQRFNPRESRETNFRQKSARPCIGEPAHEHRIFVPKLGPFESDTDIGPVKHGGTVRFNSRPVRSNCLVPARTRGTARTNSTSFTNGCKATSSSPPVRNSSEGGDPHRKFGWIIRERLGA